MTPFVVLNYHRIVVPGESVDPRYRNFVLSADVFRRHLQIIRETDSTVIDLSHPESFRQLVSTPNIALTFDDGHFSDFSIAADLLEEFGYPAAFFPVLDFIGKPGHLDWEQLKLLKQRGFTIGSHSRTHRALTGLKRCERHQEIGGAREVLSDKLCEPVDLFSIPYGRYSGNILKGIKSAGYMYALSTDPGINAENTFLLKRWNIKASVSESGFRSIIAGNHSCFIHIASKLKKIYARVGGIFSSVR